MTANANATLRSRMRNRELLLGTVVTFPSLETAELLARCGFDWLFIDAEHGQIEPADVVKILMAAAPVPCLVRIPGHDEIWIKKTLDSGAAGIIVPQVNTAEQARRIIDLCKFPPLGKRGMGLSRASGYGLDIAKYLETANESTAVVLQIEHKHAVEKIGEILSVSGFDAILVGPFDLSGSYDKPGEMDAPEVIDAIQHVTRMCIDSHVVLGTAVATVEAARSYMERGYTLVAAGADCLHLAAAARSAADTLRQAAPIRG